MSNHKQHIPTLEEIQTYLSGKAGFDLQYKVEKAMEDSPAVKEMVDGIEKNRIESSSYDEVLQKKDLDQLQRNFNQKTGYQAGFKSYNIWILITGVIVISVLTVLYVNLVDFSENNENEATTEKTSNPLTQEKEMNDNNQNSVLINDLNIEKDIQATNVSKEQKERTKTSSEYGEDESKENIVRKEEDSNNKNYDSQLVPLQKLTPNTLVIPKDKRPVKVNCKVAYYHELKMMSYRDIYNDDQSEMKLSGLPADLKNEDDEKEALTRENHIPYEKYISEGLRLFKLGKYQEFLSYIKPVLQKYPDDQNALFYGGMSELNLGNYEKASQLLEKVAYSQYDAFHEEGNWYYALSLFKSGQKDKANKIINSIIEEEGFYAERAKKLLEE